MKPNKNLINFCIFTFTVFLIYLTACTSFQKEAENKPQPIINHSPTPAPTPNFQSVYPALSWENTTQPHPERKPWSIILIDEISENFEILDKAKDIKFFCPKYESLGKDLKLQAWGEFFVALSYYESAYDPKNYSVDVGDPSDKRTYSTGLWQVSASDIENYNLSKKLPAYTFQDLLTIEPNAKLTLALMSRQIEKNGLIVQPLFKNVYWATLYRGRYDEIDQIANRVKKLKFCNK